MDSFKRTMNNVMKALELKIHAAGIDDHHGICMELANQFELWTEDEADDILPMWLMYVVAGAMRDAGLSS